MTKYSIATILYSNATQRFTTKEEGGVTMQDKTKEKVISMANYEKLMNDIAALDDNDREKVCIYIQGIMAARKLCSKQQHTA